MPCCLWCDALNPNYGKAPSLQKKKRMLKKEKFLMMNLLKTEQSLN